jgi:hypothetical protein
MAADVVGQRRHDRLAVRRQPALAAVTHHPRAQHQVRHLIRFIAFELRTFRSRHSKHLARRRHTRCHVAAATTLGAFADWLRLRRVSLQPSDLITQRCYDLFEVRYLAQQLHHQSFQLATR